MKLYISALDDDKEPESGEVEITWDNSLPIKIKYRNEKNNRETNPRHYDLYHLVLADR